ncbi:MAG: class A beta-lactamase-related serine hydrolase [Clostridiales bacterium]|nr:class A beta-lactamase-related serine hydrolase [Clostridiales bacterium]
MISSRWMVKLAEMSGRSLGGFMKAALNKNKKKKMILLGCFFLGMGCPALADVSKAAAVGGSEAASADVSETALAGASQTAGAASEVALTIPPELEEVLAEMTGIETESESETEISSEAANGADSEAETEADSEMNSREETEALKEFLKDVQLGEDFQIPMVMPAELGKLKPGNIYHCGRLSAKRSERIHSWQQEKTMESLEEQLRAILETYDGTWSVYVKRLDTNESFVINDQPMKSASVMKLFIMGTVYTAIEDGELERTDEIMSLMNAMITYSDNASSNQLLYILGNSSYADGIAKVNEFIQSHGYSEMTVEYNGFSNSATNSGNGINQVAAKDVGQLLEDIYRRTWMSRAVSNEMEEMLLAQNTRYKIPAGLPDGVLCGNKTGEMSDTQNDAAIIYSDACDYILVVLSNGWSSTDTAISRIADISGQVYEFFN